MKNKNKDISLSDITSSPIRSAGLRKPKRKTMRLLQRYHNNAPVGLGRRILFLGLPTLAAILVVAVLVVQIQVAMGLQTDISFERPAKSDFEVDSLPENQVGRDITPGEIVLLDEIIETEDATEEQTAETTQEVTEETEVEAETVATEAEAKKAAAKVATEPVRSEEPKTV
ncbi:MAG TPA: hypothetical protein GXX72_04000, partial [Clostridiaceae bacterium]|nr:hypothetical protein [Clostridiaceae bacterium]